MHSSKDVITDKRNIFNKNSNKIIIVSVGNIFNFPPVINLTNYLLNNSYRIILISENIEKLSFTIKKNKFYTGISINHIEGQNVINGLKRRFIIGKQYKKAVRTNYEEGDILWTCTDFTVRVLGDSVKNYRHVLQLMELTNKVPLYKNARFLKYPIEKYATKAWRVVVPEINRAHIQQIWWKLKETPYVLPNKPYSIDPGILSDKAMMALETIKNEKKKIVIYMGVFGFDRDLSAFADTIRNLGDEYCMYLLGRISNCGFYEENEKEFNELLQNNPNIRYLGFFPAPMHLAFLRYAHIGLLPYYINPDKSVADQMNALYCAPNKIFEYAGYGIPMIGTDVLGLRNSFEKYNIGICCDNLNSKNISNAIKVIESRYGEMSTNCKKFYDSVDMDSIIDQIINK